MRNQCHKTPQVTPPARTWRIWAGERRAPAEAGDSWAGLHVAGREATLKDCGVGVARPQGHSWAPHPSIGTRVNVGTLRRRPPAKWWWQARRRLRAPEGAEPA